MIKRFLSKFKELEKFVRINSKDNDYYNRSYLANLNEIDNYLINQKENFDLLKRAGDLRNIIVHNNDIAVPTKNFVEEFEVLVNKIINPVKSAEVMVKYDDLLKVEPKDKIIDALDKMKTKRITTIPIIKDKKLIGIFTESNLIRLMINKNIDSLKQLSNETLNDHLKDFHINSNNYYDYKFISKSNDIYHSYKLFEEGFINDERLELLFITNNGKENEELLGIISIYDLMGRL